ncbi:hypothetical protein V1514DRAFT_320123 [Lipomyces japonicus]|uniref:uncharacterized protein n=1 Tax=Lipomyces japonicus TaxID=56871 RepID=UPI0034CDC46C
MALWEDMAKHDVTSDAMSDKAHYKAYDTASGIDMAEKLKHNAKVLACSAVVKEYNAMIREGMEYSYVTTGFAIIFLRVPQNDPKTLYYYLCEPNMDVDVEEERSFERPSTALARVLCFCLMSMRSRPRNHEWRNAVRVRLPMWKKSLRYAYSQIPEDERQQVPLGSQYSEYRSWLASMDSAEPIGEEMVSDSIIAPALHAWPLQQGDVLDEHCPNVKLHRKGGNGIRHGINASKLLEILKSQLDNDIDQNCELFSVLGLYGILFKLTCAEYGYTVVGKGSTSNLWKVSSREVDVYQGSAMPVCLGEPISDVEQYMKIKKEISRSEEEIKALVDVDFFLGDEYVLWNTELSRALFIDFNPL